MTLIALLACSSLEDPTFGTAACPPWSLDLAQELTAADLVLEEPDGGVVVLGGPGIALGDLNGDGWLDALASLPVVSSVVLLNDGRGTLLPRHDARVDGAPLPPASGVVLEDLDADGDLDAILGTEHGHDDLIAWNDGTGLSWASTPLPASTGETFTPSLGDIDHDGDLDVYVGRLAAEVTPAVAEGEVVGDLNSLYRREPEGFVDVSDTLPCRDDLSFGATWLDWDADGDTDLYQYNDFGPWQDPNRLLNNDGGGVLALIEGTGAEVRLGSMGAALGDPNGDGLPDLFVTNVGPGALLLNDGSGFFDAAVASGAAIPIDDHHLASWGTVFTDVDADGWEDLMIVYGALTGGLGDPTSSAAQYGDMLVDMYGSAAEGWVDALDQRDVLLRNRGDGTFEDVSVRSGIDVGGIGRSVAIGDMDRDGRAELVTAGAGFVRQFRARGGCSPAVMRIRGGAGNPHGIGARLDVRLPDRTLVRWLHPSSTFSWSEPALYVGLGGHEQAEATVRLPTGQVRNVTLRAGESVTVEP